MRTTPLVSAFLVLVVLVASLGLWFALREPSRTDELPRPGGVTRTATDERAVELVTAPERPAAPASPEAAPAELAAERTEAAASGPERTVHGHVELPQDCRREDALIVYALDRVATVEQLAALLHYERYGDDADDDEVADAEAEADEDEDDDPEIWESHRILERAVVEADGRFELRVPGATKLVHMAVLGRLAYMADTQAVVLDGNRVEVSLGLSCGAEVAGVLVAPQGPTPVDLEGTRVRARFAGIGRQEDGLSRSARADTEGRFTIGALPARVELELLASPEEYPRARQHLGRLEPGSRTEVRVELQRGARVIGIVLDEAGAAVPAARVAALPGGSLFDLDWATRVETADNEGRFDMAGLPSGQVLMRATARGFLDSELEQLQLEEGGVRGGLELRLSGGNAIRGRVTWPDGRPAIDARVQVRFDPASRMGMGAYSAMRGSRGDGKTDDDGRFAVRGLGRGPFVIRVTGDPPTDLAPSDEEPWTAYVGATSPDGPELELVLTAPGTVRGRVADAVGAPVAEFRIVAVQSSRLSGMEIGIEDREKDFEDAEGRFAFGGLMPGSWRFFAEADGFARGVPLAFEVPLASDAPPADFVLERGARVDGIVLGFDGRPVGEAEVRYLDEQSSLARMFGNGPEAPSDRTDAAGRFTIDGLPAGEITLVARGEGYASSLPRALSVAPGEHVTGVELVLREGGRLEGEVYSSDGTPAAGATLQLLSLGNMAWRFERTDGEGRFVAARLDPGNWRVLHMPRGFGTESFASADGGSELDVGELMQDMAVAMADVVDGETTHVVLGAPPEDPVRVTGRVVLAGEPYPGAVVAFYREGTRALERMRNSNTKADGTFEIVLDAPGKHLVQVQKIGSTGGEQTSVEMLVDVPKVAEHTLLLELPGGRISGRVSAPPGTSVSGVRVSLVSTGPQASGFFFGGHYTDTTTDADGRFDVLGLREGTYELAVGGMEGGGLFGSDARFAREQRRVELGRDEHASGIDFRLLPPAKLEVKVVDEVGDPVTEAAIFVRNAETGTPLDRLSLLTTGAQGTAVYGGLLEGRYTVSARKSGRATPETVPVSVRLAETTTVRIVLAEGTMLRLELLDDDGQPLSAHYSVRDGEGREYQGMRSMEDLQEMLGKVELAWNTPQVGPLPPGEYTVQAFTEDGREASRPVSLRGQRERSLRLRLR